MVPDPVFRRSGAPKHDNANGMLSLADGKQRVDDGQELARELGRKLDVIQSSITELISETESEEPLAVDRAPVLEDVRGALETLILVVFLGDSREGLRGQPINALERACSSLAHAELPMPMPRAIRDAKPEDFERGLHRARNALRRYCLDLVESQYSQNANDRRRSQSPVQDRKAEESTDPSARTFTALDLLVDSKVQHERACKVVSQLREDFRGVPHPDGLEEDIRLQIDTLEAELFFFVLLASLLAELGRSLAEAKHKSIADAKRRSLADSEKRYRDFQKPKENGRLVQLVSELITGNLGRTEEEFQRMLERLLAAIRKCVFAFAQGTDMDNAQRARLSRALREVFYTVLQRHCKDEFHAALEKTKRQIRVAGRELLPPQSVDFRMVEWTINGIVPKAPVVEALEEEVEALVEEEEAEEDLGGEDF